MKRLLLACTLLVAVSSNAYAQCASVQTPVRVYLMYGLLSSLMSSGMSDLTDKLNRIKGVKASVHEWLSSSSLAEDAAKFNGAVAFGGHSIGANAAVTAARQLNGTRRVALILGFDPSSLASLESVPPNVDRAIGFRQDHNPFGGNTLVASSAGTSVSNQFHDINHIAIDKHTQIHAASINAVCAAGNRG
jgi:hypothetical protein